MQESPDLKDALALSGGGFRAVAFHLGVLKRLQELDLLGQFKCLSGVSVGSIVAALYCKLKSEKGADIRLRAKNGATVLTDAVQNCHEGLWNTDVELAEAVQFFLENNIDPTLKDNDRKSALDYANEFSVDSEVIQMLKSAIDRAQRSK